MLKGNKLFQFYYYVPEQYLEATKLAIFEAGAGAYKNYDQCAFVTKGMGQFRPLENSNSFIGKVGTVEQVEEYKVETLVKQECIGEVI